MASAAFLDFDLDIVLEEEVYRQPPGAFEMG
jgi:hypothetical protein